MPFVEGLTVAIVGRAASLAGSGSGSAIDAHDLVVRVNWQFPLPGRARDVGARSDVLYHCSTCIHQRESAEAHGVRTQRVDRELREQLRAAWCSGDPTYLPTTGVVAIVDALRSGARAVRAFGFDLYQSGVLYANQPPVGPRKRKHVAALDRALLSSLLADERFRPDRVLGAVLGAR